ncbi:MAG: tRNA lysidine(34) synthetase TilS [Bifidobacteriaceae bacterium]|jgi:tRNA(Ile)-lysidine synthase|nr:tRNA lysidine(34) synthetase TilS [Bifidobacteriaceae bacterium]
MSQAYKNAYNSAEKVFLNYLTDRKDFIDSVGQENWDPERPEIKNELSEIILLGVSGGADSLALAAVMSKVAHKYKFKTAAIIVDHQMQKDSDKVAEKAVEMARKAGVDYTKKVPVKVNVKAYGPEGSARFVRYVAFLNATEEFKTLSVFLGHTLNDQAETVLLGLARGSGTTAISGMREQSGLFWRPFLDITRRETEEICKELDLAYYNDPTNGSLDKIDKNYPLRSQIRHTLLPVMREVLGKDVERQLAKTAQLVGDDDETLDTLAELDFAEIVLDEPTNSVVKLDVSVLSSYPKGISSRFIKIALDNLDMDMSRLLNAHFEQIYELIYNFKGQKPLNLPHISVFRIGESLIFKKVGEYKKSKFGKQKVNLK